MKVWKIALLILILLPIGLKVNAQEQDSEFTITIGTGMITHDYQKMMTSVGVMFDLSIPNYKYGMYSITYIHTDDYNNSSLSALRTYREFRFMPMEYNMYFGVGVGVWTFLNGDMYGGCGGSVGGFICDRVAVSGGVDIILSADMHLVYSAKLSYGM